MMGQLLRDSKSLSSKFQIPFSTPCLTMGAPDQIKDFDDMVVRIAAAPIATPLPGALPLFAGGLGALGLLGWRRKRKAAAVV